LIEFGDRTQSLIVRIAAHVIDRGRSPSHASTALGFQVAPHAGRSHRKWWLKLQSGNVVLVGLVEKGHGTLKPYLIRDMVEQLRSNGVVPKEFE
jgi:hypothetical protein